MNKLDLEQYSDSLDWEMKLYQHSQGYQLNRPMITHDHNWQKLREESQTPWEITQPIDRISNFSLMLFANSQYTKGNLTCDLIRSTQRETINKNLIFEVLPELTPRQYRVWDLVITLCQLDLKHCQARRAKIFEPTHADQYTLDLAYFEIWKNQKLVWACVLVEDWLLPCKIKLNQYQNSGNYHMTCAWKNKILIEDWYKNNI